MADFGKTLDFAQGIASTLDAGASPDVRVASVTYSGQWYSNANDEIAMNQNSSSKEYPCPDGTRFLPSGPGYCLCRKNSEPAASCTVDPENQCRPIGLTETSTGVKETYTAFPADCTTCVCPPDANYGGATPVHTNFGFSDWVSAEGDKPLFKNSKYIEGTRWISAGIDYLRTDIFTSSSTSSSTARKVAIITVHGQGTQQKECDWNDGYDGSDCDVVFDFSGGDPDQPGDPDKPATVAAQLLAAQGVEIYVVGIGKLDEEGVNCDFDGDPATLPQCGSEESGTSVLKQELVNIAGGEEDRTFVAESFDALKVTRVCVCNHADTHLIGCTFQREFGRGVLSTPPFALSSMPCVFCRIMAAIMLTTARYV